MTLYAFAKYLSLKFNRELLFYIDKNYYSSTSDFNYIDFVLDKFQTKIKTIDKFINPVELKLSKYKLARYFMPKTVWSRKYLKINETLPNRLFLNDCPGNQKLFEKIKSELIADFTLKDNYIDMIDESYIYKIKKSVGIHIRGGDYISRFSEIYYKPNRQYYIDAVKRIKNVDAINKVYIFTNDKPYVEYLNLPFNYEIINDDYEDYQQFYLLSQCKHKVIANSGFSWWAAWLGVKPGLVIRPVYYFNPNNEKYSNEGIYYPEEWLFY
jgi:hypothetical protein